jgi:hypothetical protein
MSLTLHEGAWMRPVCARVFQGYESRVIDMVLS